MDPVEAFLRPQLPPGDEVTEDIDPELRAALDRVQELRARFEAVKLGVPLLGTRQHSDLMVPHGSLVGDIANLKLGLSLDHLRTVRQLLVEERWMPTDAHLTLLRPVFEGAVQARWLLDPSATPQLRVSRAFGIELGDLDEQRKIELEAHGDPDWPQQAIGWAAARTEVRKQEAMSACLLPENANTIDLLRRLGLQPYHRDARQFRECSGVLHSQPWVATRLGDQVTIRQTDSRRDTVHYANQAQAASMTTAAVDLFEAALLEYESYVGPVAFAAPK